MWQPAERCVPMPIDTVNELELEADRRVRQGLPSKLNRSLSILKNYRWDQISRRLAKVVAQKFFKAAPIAKSVDNQNPRKRREALNQTFEQLAKSIVATESPNRCKWDGTTNLLTLLNIDTEMTWPIDWSDLPSDRSHLWQFQLHYQEYLLVTENCDASFPWEFILGWIAAHSPSTTLRTDDSWHPYCISRRLPVWIWLLSLENPPAEIESKILQSIFHQAEYLANHLELELGGNHLLENLTALAIAGLFLDDPACNRWMEIVEKHLKKELPRQILDDGEHFELSPMYHCQITGNLLRMYILASEVRQTLADVLQAKIPRMLNFLGDILHPDGKIPLFGDSGFDEAPDVAQIRAISEMCPWSLPTKLSKGSIGHYHVFRGVDSEDFLLFDVGPVGASELPAHAHCDLLNFEYSIGENRWIVDSGNFNYQDDSMRAYCRSSLAHNVPTIDGANCCEIWSKFRMGRRGKIVDVNGANQQGIGWCIASHNGYFDLEVKRISRLIAYVESKSTFVCCDRCDNKTAHLEGFIHLAPKIEATRVTENMFRLRDTEGNVRVLSFQGSDRVEILKGWYCPSFGTRIENHAIRYSRLTGQPAVSWSLGPESNGCEMHLDQNETILSLGDAEHIWQFSPHVRYRSN